MRHLALAALALTLSSPAFAAAEKYELDKSHTNVLFFVNHLGFSDTVGRFDDVKGTLTLDEAAPEQSAVDIVITPATINTQSPDLNKHLQAPEWFNTAKYNTITFKSTKVTKTGADTADVTGDLTLMGVTKPVTLKAKLNKVDYFAMATAWIAGFNAETTIKRSDFGLKGGIPMVGDDVKIMISTEFHNKTKPAPAPAKK